MNYVMRRGGNLPTLCCGLLGFSRNLPERSFEITDHDRPESPLNICATEASQVTPAFHPGRSKSGTAPATPLPLPPTAGRAGLYLPIKYHSQPTVAKDSTLAGTTCWSSPHAKDNF